jgi:hypothetical protein
VSGFRDGPEILILNSIYFNSNDSDDIRRQELYAGQLYVYTARQSTRKLIGLARRLCEEAFAPFHPQQAQDHMSVERYVEILKSLKPTFIHHPEAKKLLTEILLEFGCDPQKTYMDLPRLRTVTHSGYLTSGLGYAFKPHRDTWYSTPMCQLNWWLPVYDIEPDNSMAFHPAYWSRPVQNSSNEFNYQDWNKTGRAQAASQGKKDNRRQSEALEELQLDPQHRLICETGGMIVFSAAQVHSTVPNTSNNTRFSIDFRTVHLDELGGNRGAANIDSESSGTTIRDYVRVADLKVLPDQLIAEYEQERPRDEELSPQLRQS